MKSKKNMIIIIAILGVVFFLYGLFWLFSFKEYPVEFGISFNQNHATSLELDWKQVYTEMLEDLKPKYIRIAAMWSEVEAVKGEFNFSDVDWMMDKARDEGVKVTLVVGQKAPRWPECHVPLWTSNLSDSDYKENLLNYTKEVVERYKEHPALEIWQVENEPFIRFRFGECEGFRVELTYDEIDLVRSLDDEHKIMVTDSGELSTWRRASRAGDIFGTTLYRVVRKPSGGIFTYDWMPAGFYRIKSFFWGEKLDSFYISELQAEPWFTNSNPLNTSIEVQEETINIGRLQKNINFAGRVGASRVYLWGVEWWFWMKDEVKDGKYWEEVKRVMN